MFYSKRCQTVIAALHEKDEKDNEEEAALIIKTRCQKNWKKSAKICSEAMRGLGGSQNGAILFGIPLPSFSAGRGSSPLDYVGLLQENETRTSVRYFMKKDPGHLGL